MSKHFFLYIAAFILIAFHSLATYSVAAEDTKPSILTKKIKTQQYKIKRVQKGIEEHKELVRKSRKKETNLFDQLEIIDLSIKESKAKLADLKEKTALQEKLIEQKTDELAVKNSAKDVVRKHVEKRLAAFYRMGDIGFFNVTFSAGNLPDLLSFNEYFKALIKYDQKITNDYRQKIKILTEVKNILEQEKIALQAVTRTVNKQEIHLESVRKERLALLAKVNTEKKLYRQAIEEMEEASINLTETLADLREKLVKSQSSQKLYFSSPKKRRPGASRGFPSMKGKLIPPVRGSVSTYFGKSKQGKFGITTYADGININTVAGNEIKAVYDGKVVYAGKLKGYGNLIIIDHDFQYYTLISRAAELYKKEGDIVSTGEVIGIMTENGGLLGEGLHFEIRHGTEPENPLNWINNRLLTFTFSKHPSKSGPSSSPNN